MKMDFVACVIVNVTLFIFNTVTITFYIFCMVRPLHRERIKQPLKLLLWICCKVAYLAALAVVICSLLLTEHDEVIIISESMSISSISTSMTTCAWMCFYYYIQIVPAQGTLSIWIKRNVKTIIYYFWVLERIYILFDFSFMSVHRISRNNNGFDKNLTTAHDLSTAEKDYWRVVLILVTIVKAHFTFCLGVMLISISSTAVYLCKHIQNMVAAGKPLTCPQLRGQVRVTITGTVQGVLYLFCSVWIVYDFLSQYAGTPNIDPFTLYTVINLYTSASAFNLGFGQAVFRQRATDIWIRATQWCKTSTEPKSEQRGRSDIVESEATGLL